MPGTYEAAVENREDANGATLKIQGIVIEAGKTTEKVEEFSGGALMIKTIRNDKPLRAYCIVYAAVGGDEENDKKEVVEGWTEPDGTAFNLAPRANDVMVEDQEVAGKPVLKFAGLTLEAGKTVEKTADFSGGTLKVTASRTDKPFSAFCVVFAGAGKDRKQTTRGLGREDGATFQLPPGGYDPVVENQADASKPSLEFKGIAVEASKTVEKVAEFSGGSLRVKALRNAKPSNAFYAVLKSGDAKDRKKITPSSTLQESASFKLLPGVYDIEVENQADSPKSKVEFKQVSVEAGKSLEMGAEFSGAELRVWAARNSKPFTALGTVFSSGEGNDRTQVTRGQIRKEGTTFQHLPGSYALVVEDSKTREKKELKDTVIEGGKSLTVDVQF